jgi:hypothetical protein
MTFNDKATVYAALGLHRRSLLASWLNAYKHSLQSTAFWAREILALNDAEAALRKVVTY